MIQLLVGLLALFLVLLLILLCTLVVIVYILNGIDWRYHASVWLADRAVRTDVEASHYRNAFSDTPVPLQPDPRNHTHPHSAALRSAASSFMEYVAIKMGHRPYILQQSATDQRRALAGSRAYYWAKDTQTMPSPRVNASTDAVIIVDTDYYMDMPEELLKCPRYTQVYTIQPESVAHTESEYSFTFNREDELEMRIRGGATYTHKLWNYGRDTLLVTAQMVALLVPR